MVTHSEGTYRERRNLGDTAVDGLLHGLVAGGAMILVLTLLEWFGGKAPYVVLEAFGSRAPANAVNGLFSHLAVSAVYGILWAFLLNAKPGSLRAPRWLVGIAYGLLLFAFAELVVAPNSGLRIVAPLFLLIAHMVYGLTLGLLSRRH